MIIPTTFFSLVALEAYTNKPGVYVCWLVIRNQSYFHLSISHSTSKKMETWFNMFLFLIFIFSFSHSLYFFYIFSFFHFHLFTFHYSIPFFTISYMNDNSYHIFFSSCIGSLYKQTWCLRLLVSDKESVLFSVWKVCA